MLQVTLLGLQQMNTALQVRDQLVLLQLDIGKWTKALPILVVQTILVTPQETISMGHGMETPRPKLANSETGQLTMAMMIILWLQITAVFSLLPLQLKLGLKSIIHQLAATLAI